MIEIGKSRIIKIRRRAKDGPHKGKLMTVLDNKGQPETRIAVSEVTRITKDVLDGSFGCDRNRRLVATLKDGDLLELRPQGRRLGRKCATLADIYRWMHQCASNQRQLEKARAAKENKKRRRESRRIANADRRLRKQARHANQSATR